MFLTEYPEFVTITCLEWKPLLAADREKEIIIESMRFLVNAKRIKIFAFVIMQNHLHLIQQILNGYNRAAEQRNFLKFTGQQMLKNFRNEKSNLLQELFVGSTDRKHQVWERNSLSIPLWSGRFIDQKLDYIHMNPVKAGLVEYPEAYKYSSARFYLLNEKNWDFLSHIDG